MTKCSDTCDNHVLNGELHCNYHMTDAELIAHLRLRLIWSGQSVVMKDRVLFTITKLLEEPQQEKEIHTIIKEALNNRLKLDPCPKCGHDYLEEA